MYQNYLQQSYTQIVQQQVSIPTAWKRRLQDIAESQVQNIPYIIH